MDKEFENALIEDLIIRALEDGKILVFPKEISARSYLNLYSKRKKKAVFSDRAMSFDTFKKMFRTLPENKTEASVIHRYLFIDSFFRTERFKELRYFANPEFKTSLRFFQKSIVSNLPFFNNVLFNGKIRQFLPEEAQRDMRIILSSYNEFLEKNNAYEPEYIKPDFSKAEENTYVLVFPSCVEDPAVIDALNIKKEKGEPLFEVLDAELKDGSVELNRMDVYENSLSEIRSRVREIYRLLVNEKTRCSDIVVTLNQAESYLPYFVSECGKRNIPLNIQQGKKLSDYEVGTLFSDIKLLYSSEFEFSSLKKFLLNPAYPFKKKDLIHRIIRFAIDCKADKTIEKWKDKLSKAEVILEKNEESRKKTSQDKMENSSSNEAVSDENPSDNSGFPYTRTDIGSIRAFISDLYLKVKSINISSDASSLRGAFHALRNTFFEEKKGGVLFVSDTEDKALERALDVLENAEKACSEFKIAKTEGFFDLFLNLLSSVNYTPDNKNAGIRVYSYPQTKAMYSPYHFVLGLSDSEVQQERKGPSFLRETEGEKDVITDSVLKSYAFKSSGAVYLSCANTGFDSESTAPALFVEKELINRVVRSETDSFKTEEALWFNGADVFNDNAAEQNRGFSAVASPDTRFSVNQIKPCANQIKQFFSSRDKLFRSTEKNDYSGVELPVSLSASRIEEYEKCSYRWYCSYKYGLNNQDYEIKMSDSRDIGNLLHDTFETFYGEIKHFDEFRLHSDRFAEIFKEKLSGMANSIKAPDYVHLYELSLQEDDYRDCIDLLEDSACLSGFSSEATEKEIFYETEEYEIKGRIDCIMKNADGNYAVIDFKRTKAGKEPLQVVLYACLLGENAEYKRVPVVAVYYVIKEKKFKFYSGRYGKDSKNTSPQNFFGWTENDFDEVYPLKSEELQKCIEDMLSGIKAGDFEPKTPDCAYCAYRQICRKRYVIK